MRLELSPLALTDLEAIGDYIALDSPGNARRKARECWFSYADSRFVIANEVKQSIPQ